MQREHRQSSKAGRRVLALVGILALTAAGTGTAFAAGNPIANKEWALNALQNSRIHSQFDARGAGVVVAVIDSGVDPIQPDLRGSIVTGVNLVNPIDPSSNTNDDNSESHGTAIATIIAAHAHYSSDRTKIGMVGLADNAKILPIKIGLGNSSGSNASLVASIKYATNQGARVINISNGPNGECPNDIIDAIDYALSHNVVVVVATGNTATTGNEVGCPAPVPGVIDVASIAENNRMDVYSHYGPDVSVAAPGVDIEAGLTKGKYGDVSGSSFAAPWVAAEAALIIGLHPNWTQGQVVAAIIDNTAQSASGQTQHGKRLDDHVGYGVIDPVAALAAPEPASTANPLGGPAVSVASESSSAPNSATTAPGGAGDQTPAASASSPSKSSSIGLIVGIIIVVIVAGGLVLFAVKRGNRRGGGKGGPGGRGGGGGNGYYPPNSPGGQYAQPPQAYQQPNPYQQQGTYQPQQGSGGYGQQQGQGPYGAGPYGQQQ